MQSFTNLINSVDQQEYAKMTVTDEATYYIALQKLRGHYLEEFPKTIFHHIKKNSTWKSAHPDLMITSWDLYVKEVMQILKNDENKVKELRRLFFQHFANIPEDIQCGVTIKSTV